MGGKYRHYKNVRTMDKKVMHTKDSKKWRGLASADDVQSMKLVKAGALALTHIPNPATDLRSKVSGGAPS